MTFAERLRELRTAAGLTEKQLADASGVTFAAIRNYVHGRRAPSFEAVLALAKALGTDCRAFAGCEFPYQRQPAAGKRAARRKRTR
jgi:transcriptional regulator with XRE-family HTH domain